MAINNKFLHFSTRNGFLKEISKYVTFTEPNTYVVKSGKEDDWNYFKNFTVFIKDTQQIWVREQFYNCSVSLDTVMKGSQYLIDYNNENQKVGVSFDGNLTSGTASFIAAYKRVPKTGLIAGIQPITAGEVAKKIGESADSVIWNGNVYSSNITKITKTSYQRLRYLDRLQESTTRNNYFAFLKPESVTLEGSTDGGETWEEWTESTAEDDKRKLFSTSNITWCFGNWHNGDTITTDVRARCTINFPESGLHGHIDTFAFYMSIIHDSTMYLEYTKKSDPDTWIELVPSFKVSGSPVWYVVHFPDMTVENYLGQGQVEKVRATFSITTISEKYPNATNYLMRWRAYGQVIYSGPSNYAASGHIYSYSHLQEVNFPSMVKATKFYTSGGTYTQFVKGDGSLDSNTYLTTSGNAASSSKLQTARKLWGQSFNGTADISGAITSTGLVTATGFKITGKTGLLKADGTVDTTTYLSSIPISTTTTIGGIKSQIVSATTSLTETTHTKLPVIVNSDGTAYSELKNTNLPNIPASLLTGTIDIERLPQGALERLTIVADQEARFALTTDTVQNGDTVKQTDTEKLYFVVDDTKLNSEEGYEPYSTGTATSVPWSGITGKPSWIKETKPSYDSTEISGGWITTSDYAMWEMARETYVQSSDTIAQAINRVEWRAEHGPKINGHRLEATYGGYWTFDSDCMDITFGLEEPEQLLHFNAKPATSSSYGMIKVGTGLSISNGVLSVNGTLLTTSAQTITGIKTFKNTIIGTSQENAWATSYNYQKAALGVLQTSKDALCTAVCMETAETSKRYFNISTFGNRFLISASTEKDNWNHDWADGGIFIQTNGCTTSNNGTWTFGGFTSYPDNPVWTINEKGVFSGTARNCGLITATLSNKIEAGYTYNNTSATAISTFSGFSELKPDATVISTKVIKFTGTGIIKAEYLDSMTISTNQYIIYTFSYMPNGKIAINGSIYE